MARLWDEVGVEFGNEKFAGLLLEEKDYQKKRTRELFEKSVGERIWKMIARGNRRVASNPLTFGG